jgi:hypothetical protein
LNNRVLLAAIASLSLLVGCGEIPGLDGGSTTSCTAGSCGAGKSCHPVLKTCVTSCTIRSDCSGQSPALTVCDQLGGVGDKFCQCVSGMVGNTACGMAQSGEICQPTTLRCTARCTNNASCTGGGTCNSATGECSYGGTSMMDAGTDAGMMGTACTPANAGTVCTAGQICNAGMCGAAAACMSANPQPAMCGAGQFCSGTSCANAPFAPTTCNNIGSTNPGRMWTFAAGGPVIYEITKVSFGENMTFCGMMNPIRAKVQIKVYDPAATGRLVSQTSQPSLQYYRTDGTPLTVGATQIQDYMSTNMGKNATLDINFCAPTGTNSLPIGLVYDNGNPVCFTVN